MRISVRAQGYVAMPMVGFMLRNQLGIDFSGTNTAREAYELAPLQSGDIITVDFYIDLPELYASAFSFSPAIADGTLATYEHVRLDRQCGHAANGAIGRRDLRIYSPAVPRRSELGEAPCLNSRASV